MKKLILVLPLICGCGVTLTTSEFKAGIIDEVVTCDGNGSRVIHEDILGIHIQWLPYFSFGDIRQLFNKHKK